MKKILTWTGTQFIETKFEDLPVNKNVMIRIVEVPDEAVTVWEEIKLKGICFRHEFNSGGICIRCGIGANQQCQ